MTTPPAFLDERGCSHFQRFVELLGDDFRETDVFVIALLAHEAQRCYARSRGRIGGAMGLWFDEVFPRGYRNREVAKKFLRGQFQ